MKKAFFVLIILGIFMFMETFSMSIWKQRFRTQTNPPQNTEDQQQSDGQKDKWISVLKDFLFGKQTEKFETKFDLLNEIKRLKMLKAYLLGSSVIKDFFPNRIM
jgi:hypothetical protein